MTPPAPIELRRALAETNLPGARLPAGSFGQAPTWLRRPSIHVPDEPDGAIERHGLLGRVLSEPVDRPFLLVSAPAGFGKTTFLAQWARLQRAAGISVAWVTCTEDSREPARLLRDIRDALALALEDRAPRTSAQLLEVGEPSSGAVAAALTELALILDDATESVILVLDDVHCAESEGSMGLLESLAVRRPSGLRLAFSARTMPGRLLTTLRLRSRLTEVVTGDLVFTRSEVAAVIGTAGGGSEQLADPLLRQTEGWPAAVRLGVLAARAGSGDGSELPITFDPSVSDYLNREVLAALPPEATELLRDTAVVSEVNAALAAALSARPDSGAILEGLFTSQALVRRVGSPDPWYVVHSLLRAHFLSDLQAQDIAAPARQHAIAAEWLAAHDRPKSALEHALAAEDPALTGRVLRMVGLRLIVDGQHESVSEALATIPSKLRDDDLVAQAALIRAASGDVAAARRMLDDHPATHAQAEAATANRAVMPSLLRVAEFYVGRLEGSTDIPAFSAAFPDILGWQADPEVPDADVDRALLLLLNRGRWELGIGRYADCWADLHLAQRLAGRHRRDAMELRCLGTLAAAPALRGDAATTAQYVDETLALIERRGWSTVPAVANVFSAGAWAAAMMLLPKRAEDFIARATACAHGDIDPEYRTYATLIDATLAADRAADPAQALEVLAALAQGGPLAGMGPDVRVFAGMQRVRIQLRRGELASALAAAEQLERWVPGTADPDIGRAQVLAARGMWRECLGLLRAVESGDRILAAAASQIFLPLLTAVASAQLGRGPAAHGALLRALSVAEPRGVIRPFYDAGPVARNLLADGRGRFGRHEDFVATILKRCEAADRLADGVSAHDARDAGLTPRERDVLQELGSLMTAEEIADVMVLSVNTVRTHMRSVYRKLCVQTRRDAVRKGLD